MRVLRYRNRLLSEVLESPSLVTFRVGLDVAVNSSSWTKWSLKVLSDLSDSVNGVLDFGVHDPVDKKHWYTEQREIRLHFNICKKRKKNKVRTPASYRIIYIKENYPLFPLISSRVFQHYGFNEKDVLTSTVISPSTCNILEFSFLKFWF